MSLILPTHSNCWHFLKPTPPRFKFSIPPAPRFGFAISNFVLLAHDFRRVLSLRELLPQAGELLIRLVEVSLQLCGSAG